MASKKIQLYTDRDKTIEASPETSANCVILSDGNDLQKVLDNDLTNPTVVHEETSFKVGVGDINVSSSVVDGEVGRMVIKGKTYQNILPEPSTHVLTNNKEMFKVNEGLDPNVEIVDGVSKSAILTGNTLVNLMTQYKDETLVEYYYPVRNPDVANVSMLKPNTEYTLIFKAKYQQDGDVGRLVVQTTTDTNEDIGISGWDEFTTEYKTYIRKFTTPSNPKYFVLRTNSNYFYLKECVLLEGDYTNVDIPYFEGMKSVKMPVLKATGKNLFDGVSYIDGFIASANNYTVSYDADVVSILVNVNKNTDYILSAKTSFNRNTVGGSLEPISNGTKTTNLNSERLGDNKIKFNSGEYTNVIIYLNSSKIDIEELQVEEGTVSTSYEPYKSNILHTPEEVVLRSVENAQDTINLNTGEYVQRIGEVILNGSESWQVLDNNTENTIGFTLRKVLPLRKTGDKYVKVNCDKLPSYKENLWNNDKIGCVAENNINQDLNDTQLQVRVLKSTLSTQDTNGFKSWLQTNPLTIQYILETPVVKTVDLSSSGNWEKVVYSGASNESWSYRQEYDTTNTYCFKNNRTLTNALLVNQTCPSFSDNLPINGLNVDKHSLHINGQPNVIMKIDKKLINEPTDINLRQYLQQNPITVWYQTSTTVDSTQVKQPIFFEDGHIQLSSGAENSLIPTLDYQAKTSNSYVMDLMKTGTTYTIKASSISGTATIGNAGAFTLNTNRTIVSPSSSLMDNKLLVIKGLATDLMILEGDLTSKAIPYFKGIKSAFEDESKIEVLSTGKNLLDKNLIVNEHASGNYLWTKHYNNQPSVSLKPKTTYTLYLSSFKGDGRVYLWEKGVKSREIGIPNEGLACSFTTTDLEDGFSFYASTSSNGDTSTVNVWLEQSTGNSTYEPYKSNSTKIPLLSPLRSLPDGTCDELIIDRMKKKATLIQRVGVDIYNGSETWGCYNESSSKTVEGYHHTVQNLGGGANNTNLLSNSFRANYRSIHNRDEEGVGSQQDATYSNVRICISRTKLFPLGYTVGQNQVAYFQKWLQSNPVTVLYPLLTPVVTEIDLENFPLVYKDGHIFLNSEIAPVIEIDCNVNQAQQIQANNETLQRHELDILDLDNLIVSFVNAEYNLRLLKFDMELSMMALAE